jgi:hypothetical protein
MAIPVVPLINRIARLALIHAGETTLKFRLGMVPRSIDVTTLLSQVVPEEATFTGYTAGGIAVTWTTGYIAPPATPSNESQLFEFIMSTPTVTNTIYYWWIDDATKIILAGQLDTPVPLATAGAALKIMVEDSYPPGLPAVQVVP